jgi:hypothetical protein
MTVANHLTLNELRRRAKKAKDPIEKDRFLAVYHAKRGLTAKEIARIIPNTPRWVQEMVRRYNQESLEALKEQRHQNPGQKPKPEGSFLRPSLGYPVAYPFAPGRPPSSCPSLRGLCGEARESSATPCTPAPAPGPSGGFPCAKASFAKMEGLRLLQTFLYHESIRCYRR